MMYPILRQWGEKLNSINKYANICCLDKLALHETYKNVSFFFFKYYATKLMDVWEQLDNSIRWATHLR